VRRAAPLGALLALFALAPAAGAATIQGHVLKGAERAPASGIPISLHPVRNDQELPGQTVSSGPDGSFSFAGVAKDPSTSYFLSTEYEGAFYTEGPVEFTGETGVKDLQIYDVGRDLASVRVTNHHIVVERAEDHLHVTEILIFQNDGSTAYLGTGLNHAENAGVRLGLPASVNKFEPGMGGDEGSVVVQGRDLSSRRPIPPGQRPFSFSYEIPLSGRMDLSHRLYFPTDAVDIMINDPGLKIEGGSLTYGGSRDQGGKKFEIYQAKNLPVGSEITMRVHGAGFWSNPKIYPWLAAPFVIAAVLIFASRRGRTSGGQSAPASRAGHEHAPRDSRGPAVAPQASPVATLRPAQHGSNGDDDLPTVYLYLIEALDKGLERGEFTRESHDLVRGNLKRRLEAILSDRAPTQSR
jgi:hypothetical protein